jgi:hypothetical protein
MQKGLPEFPAIMFGEQYPFSDYVEYMECERYVLLLLKLFQLFHYFEYN